MRLLVLGGPRFLGRAIADAALARGHELTFFNRGQTNPELYPEIERLRGDRAADLGALEGREWDAVIDTCGFVPRVVRASAQLLADAVAHYTFVSSMSAYVLPVPAGFDERAPLEDPELEREEIMEHYGPLKVACEGVVAKLFPGRSALIRAGLIVGPHDPTDRFTYWPIRIARGGDVLAPGTPERTWQFIDVRDLGAWIVHVAEQQEDGAFNATGPVPATTAGDVLETCRTVAGSDARLVWVDDEFLLEHGVGQWMELPLWLAEDGDAAQLHEADVSRAVAAGLVTRPIAETVRDTLAWARTRDGRGAGTAAMGGTEGVGLDSGRERELLAAWRDRT